MADRPTGRHKIVHDRTIPAEEEGWRLGGWVFFSCILHAMLISGLFIFPRVPFPKAPEYPIYTVDLLGGEKLGGRNLGSQVVTVTPPKPAPKPKPEPKPVKVEPPPPAPDTKKKAPVQEEKVVLKEKEAKKEPPKEVKKVPVKEAVKEPEPNQGLPEQLRERMLQAALDRVKNRVETERKRDAEEQVIQSGPGEGEGADAPGEGGKGGGKIVKGVEFLIYRNRMLSLIQESWTWVGRRRDDLKVTVRFGIREDGEIVGLRILQASGDPSYDDSVFRAIKKASPLPPPPQNYREEFMEVNLTFLPKDLGN